MLRSKSAALKEFIEREIAEDGDVVNIVLRNPAKPGSYEVHYISEDDEPLVITESRWADAFLAGYRRGRGIGDGHEATNGNATA
jgi:hypothetical protein